MGELAGLIERVEKASGADRELDVLLHAILVDGREVIERDTWVLGRNRKPPHDECVLGRIDPGRSARNFTPAYHKPEQPDYTASIDAALALVERMLPGYRLSLDQMKDGWDVDLSLPGNRTGVFSETAETAALAIILALLRALEARK